MYTAKSFNMNSKESLKYQVILKYLDGKIFRKETARLLSFSERTIIRYSQKIKKLGVFGVKLRSLEFLVLNMEVTERHQIVLNTLQSLENRF